MSGSPAGSVAEGARAPERIESADSFARTVRRLRAAIGAATLVMLGMSWPLWVPSDAFPRVPFIPRLGHAPSIVGWAALLVLIGSLITTVAGLAWRLSLALGVFCFAFLIAQDQHRFQPWVYQYMVAGSLLVGLPAGKAIACERWWFASIYAYSGLSKLDRSFCDELGRLFLETAAHPLGIVPETWPDRWRIAAILAMPAAELAIALTLCLGRLRRVGLAGALLLHVMLLQILGPLGLGHSTIVLVWNVAMMVEVAILFGPSPHAASTVPAQRAGWLERAVTLGFWIALVAPLGERWGILDSWPAHALYASHVERTWVEIPEDELGDYPAIIQRHCHGGNPWHRLDFTGWSREVRGVPVYPQARACLGLAEALAARYGGHRSIRVVQWGRADAWSGRRTRTDSFGLEAIRRQAVRYWFNAHPSDAPGTLKD